MSEEAPRKTLQQMAAEAAASGNGGIACTNCGCRDLRTYRTIQRQASTTRYKACRHCGKRFVTSSVSVEHIVHEVNTRAEVTVDPESDPLADLMGE